MTDAASVAVAVAYLVLGSAALPMEDFRLMLAGGAVIWLWAAAVSFAAMPAIDHEAEQTSQAETGRDLART